MGYLAGDALRAVCGLQSNPHPKKQSAVGSSASFSLPPERRLRKGSDFQAVRNNGRSWANNLLVLRLRPNGLDVTRFGFSVSKRVGNAVVRNQVKRRLKEYTRQTPMKSGWDLVFIARGPAAQASYQTLTQAASNLLSRAALLLATDSGDSL